MYLSVFRILDFLSLNLQLFYIKHISSLINQRTKSPPPPDTYYLARELNQKNSSNYFQNQLCLLLFLTTIFPFPLPIPIKFCLLIKHLCIYPFPIVQFPMGSILNNMSVIKNGNPIHQLYC